MGLVLLALLAVRPAGLRDVHLFKPREKALVNLKLTGEILKIKPTDIFISELCHSQI